MSSEASSHQDDRKRISYCADLPKKCEKHQSTHRKIARTLRKTLRATFSNGSSSNNNSSSSGTKTAKSPMKKTLAAGAALTNSASNGSVEQVPDKLPTPLSVPSLDPMDSNSMLVRCFNILRNIEHFAPNLAKPLMVELQAVRHALKRTLNVTKIEDQQQITVPPAQAQYDSWPSKESHYLNLNQPAIPSLSKSAADMNSSKASKAASPRSKDLGKVLKHPPSTENQLKPAKSASLANSDSSTHYSLMNELASKKNPSHYMAINANNVKIEESHYTPINCLDGIDTKESHYKSLNDLATNPQPSHYKFLKDLEDNPKPSHYKSLDDLENSPKPSHYASLDDMSGKESHYMSMSKSIPTAQNRPLRPQSSAIFSPNQPTPGLPCMSQDIFVSPSKNLAPHLHVLMYRIKPEPHEFDYLSIPKPGAVVLLIDSKTYQSKGLSIALWNGKVGFVPSAYLMPFMQKS